MWQLKWKGQCRVYVNREEDFPLVWSIDDGNSRSEINVKHVHTSLVRTYGVYLQKKDREEGFDKNLSPIFWIQCDDCAVYLDPDSMEAKLVYR